MNNIEKGQAMIALRESKGVKRKEMAERMNISYARLGNLENGVTVIQQADVHAFCLALDLPLSALSEVALEVAESVVKQDSPHEDRTFILYAWFLPRYESEEPFPIKIGCSTRSVESRLADCATYMPEKPQLCFELHLPTKGDMEWWESMFHRSLPSAPDAPGKEFVLATPQQIREVFDTCEKMTVADETEWVVYDYSQDNDPSHSSHC